MDLSAARSVAAVVHNDRAAFRSNVVGLHMFLATMTRTPLWALSEPEADGLSESACAVLDYHGIDLSSPGSLHIKLGVVMLSVYGMRLLQIRQANMAAGQRPTMAATPNAAMTPQMRPIDLSGDHAA